MYIWFEYLVILIKRNFCVIKYIIVFFFIYYVFKFEVFMCFVWRDDLDFVDINGEFFSDVLLFVIVWVCVWFVVVRVLCIFYWFCR